MSGDYTRFTFNPSKNFSGVRKQQGRVDLDADWNEAVDIQDRRWRAQTIDMAGRTFVSRETPEAFKIEPDGNNNNFKIGVGRIYVDGLLAENHGKPGGEKIFVTVLAEERDTVPPSYLDQPYLPKNAALTPGKYLVYLDVWQREVTCVEEDGLLDKALGGADTTTRLQTVWQVKVLKQGGGMTLDCHSKIPESALPTGRLTSFADAPPASDDPCVISPSGGYRGVENRLYRIEIHDEGNLPGRSGPPPSIPVDPHKEPGRFTLNESASIDLLGEGMLVDVRVRLEGGWVRTVYRGRIRDVNKEDHSVGLDTGHGTFDKDIYKDINELHPLIPTFKWSRDNASIVSAVTNVVGQVVTVQSLGRDEDMRFKVGEWVEVLDDHRELHGEPGEMARITTIDGANRQITLDRSVPSTGSRAFASNNGADTHSYRHTRIRRWDQTKDVGTSGVLPVSAGPIEIEHGIKVSFSVSDNVQDKDFRSGDYWVFAARTADGSVEKLEKVPPRGIHHHYCNLAVIKVDAGKVTVLNDCRPRATTGASCCTITVGDGVTSHGDYRDIQQAIEEARRIQEASCDLFVRVCILPGRYEVTKTINIISGSRIIVSGCGLQTLIVGRRCTVFKITGGSEIVLQSLYLLADKEGTEEPPCALDMQGYDIRIENNRICGGGIWVKGGSANIAITHNEIMDGIGPGILIGKGTLDSSDTTGNATASFVFVRRTRDAMTGLKKQKVVSGAELDVTQPGDLSALFLSAVSKMHIRDNVIQGMGGSGITTVYGVHLNNLNNDVQNLGWVEELVIENNRIENCVVDPPDCSFPDRSSFGAGIVLTMVMSGVSIRNNYVANNGKRKGADQQASGILIGYCEKLELCGNTVIHNGSLTPPTDGEKKYFQTGVAILSCVTGEEFFTDYYPQSTIRDNILTALCVTGEKFPARIHSNTISCPAGQALVVFGLGPMSVSVLQNDLTSKDFKQQPAVIKLDTLGNKDRQEWIETFIEILTKVSCVFILNLGLTTMRQNVIAMSAKKLPSLSENAVGLVNANLQSNLQYTALGAIASVGIESAHNSISDNHFSMNLKSAKSDSVNNNVVDVFSIAGGVQACGNLFAESLIDNLQGQQGQVASYVSVATFNICTSNMAAHPFSFSFFPGPTGVNQVANNIP